MNEEELQEMAEDFYTILDPKTKEEMKQKWVEREARKLQIPLNLPKVRKVRLDIEDEQNPLLLGS